MTADDWIKVMDNFFWWILGIAFVACMFGFFDKD